MDTNKAKLEIIAWILQLDEKTLEKVYALKEESLEDSTIPKHGFK